MGITRYTQPISDLNKNPGVRKLGQGNYSIVYLWQNQVIKDFIDEYFEIAKDEIEIMNYVRNRRIPWTVKITGYFFPENAEQQGLPQIMMEFKEGGDLSELISPYLKWENCSIIARELSRGVSYLHDAEIIHGDLKPQNIVLDKNLNAYIADFGSARMLKNKEKPTRGTPLYAAPEIVLSIGEFPSKNTTATDVFALALVLWELFSGMRFENWLERTRAQLGHFNDEFFASRVNGDLPNLNIVPKKYSFLITWGLNKNPEQRPTASQFSTHLEQKENTTPRPY